MFKYYISIALLGIFVFALIIGGIIIAGSPISQKDIQLDNNRLQAFESIKYQIENYYTTNHKLPTSLGEISSSINIQDSETKTSFDYKIIPPYSYQLCTTFSTDNSKTVTNSYNNYGLDSALYKTHKKGYDCIELKLSSYLMNSTQQPSPQATSTSPTASITGPAVGSIGQQLTFTATANAIGGNLLQGEIWIAMSNQSSPIAWGCPSANDSPWCLITRKSISGSTATFNGSWTPSAPGAYYIAVNASDSSGKKCTGNPFAGNTCGIGSYKGVITESPTVVPSL